MKQRLSDIGQKAAERRETDETQTCGSRSLPPRSLVGLPRDEIQGGDFWKGGCYTERERACWKSAEPPLQSFWLRTDLYTRLRKRLSQEGPLERSKQVSPASSHRAGERVSISHREDVLPRVSDWVLGRILPHAVQFSSVAQSCPTLCDPMDCSLLGSSVHGILQARILEWVVISSSRGSSQPRDWTRVSCVSRIGRKILYHWATWEALHRTSISN